MTDNSNLVDLDEKSGLVSFSNRLIESPAFLDLFERGMSLVEEAANYLDTVGREQSKAMERSQSLAYATDHAPHHTFDATCILAASATSSQRRRNDC